MSSAQGTRMVHADNDPVTHAPANALLTGTGATKIILAGGGAFLDFTKPAALLLVVTLHFIPDPEDPASIVMTERRRGTRTRGVWRRSRRGRPGGPRDARSQRGARGLNSGKTRRLESPLLRRLDFDAGSWQSGRALPGGGGSRGPGPAAAGDQHGHRVPGAGVRLLAWRHGSFHVARAARTGSPRSSAALTRWTRAWSRPGGPTASRPPTRVGCDYAAVRRKP